MSKFTKIAAVLLMLFVFIGTFAVSGIASMEQDLVAGDNPFRIVEKSEITSVVESEMNNNVIMGNVGLSFPNLQVGGVARTAGTWQITPGVDVLRINTLTWGPSGQNIHVGIQNAQTPGRVFVLCTFSAGSVINVTLSTANIPAGEYHVVVWSELGPAPVTGAMNFRWFEI